eukprot:GHVS01042592.1.p1 GENE.GHVS01042592.1~~GHVS01042592.1.p1  ORF type:complete len:283 (+),score=51.94 GHVS01042592.1:424-1272(+)
MERMEREKIEKGDDAAPGIVQSVYESELELIGAHAAEKLPHPYHCTAYWYWLFDTFYYYSLAPSLQISSLQYALRYLDGIIGCTPSHLGTYHNKLLIIDRTLRAKPHREYDELLNLLVDIDEYMEDAKRCVRVFPDMEAPWNYRSMLISTIIELLCTHDMVLVIWATKLVQTERTFVASLVAPPPPPPHHPMWNEEQHRTLSFSISHELKVIDDLMDVIPPGAVVGHSTAAAAIGLLRRSLKEWVEEVETRLNCSFADAQAAVPAFAQMLATIKNNQLDYRT